MIVLNKSKWWTSGVAIYRSHVFLHSLARSLDRRRRACKQHISIARDLISAEPVSSVAKQQPP